MTTNTFVYNDLKLGYVIVDLTTECLTEQDGEQEGFSYSEDNLFYPFYMGVFFNHGKPASVMLEKEKIDLEIKENRFRSSQPQLPSKFNYFDGIEIRNN